MTRDDEWPDGELSAEELVETMRSAGWRMVTRRIRAMADQAMRALRGGGPERHHYNAGYLQALEDVLSKSPEWAQEAERLIAHERREVG